MLVFVPSPPPEGRAHVPSILLGTHSASFSTLFGDTCWACPPQTPPQPGLAPVLPRPATSWPDQGPPKPHTDPSMPSAAPLIILSRASST